VGWEVYAHDLSDFGRIYKYESETEARDAYSKMCKDATDYDDDDEDCPYWKLHLRFDNDTKELFAKVA
jgi:hypothetical protein